MLRRDMTVAFRETVLPRGGQRISQSKIKNQDLKPNGFADISTTSHIVV